MEFVDYQEPELSYLVLDFKKETETRVCLDSIKKHTLFPHKIIYLHNGADEEYPLRLLKEGKIDHFIQTRQNTGLAVGTRDLFAGCFSPYAFYLQNDQFLKRDFSTEEFHVIKKIIGGSFRSPHDGSIWTAASVDLAGGMWGLHGYSERGHIIPTATYKKWESEGIFGYRGAGPYDKDPWREEQVQKHYKTNKLLHFTYPEPLVADNGHRALRENPDGSIWEHKTDTGGLRLIKGPVKEKASYPHFSEEEWAAVIKTQSWPEWETPKKERGNA